MIGPALGHGAIGGPILTAGDVAPLIVTINGQVADVLQGSIEVTGDLGARTTASFAVKDPYNELWLDGGERVIITYDSIRVFAGHADEPEYEFIGANIGTLKIVSCEAVDFNEYADRPHIANVYESQTADAIVTDILTTYLAQYGVTAGDIQSSSITFDRVVFNYDPASRALTDLADAIGWEWRIDEYRQLHFYDPSTRYAPFSITDADDPRKYRPGLRCRRSMQRYRNKQIFRAGKDLLAAATEDQLGDGKKRSFNDLRWPIGEAPTVEVDIAGGGFTSQTVGVIGVDDEDAVGGFDWFWRKGTKTLAQNTNATKLTTSDTLRVTYRGLADVLIIEQDTAEVAAQAARDGTSGVVESVDEDSRVESVDHAGRVVEGLLRKYGRIPCIVEGQTDEAGLLPGQLLTFQLTAERIVGQFLVQSVSIADRGDGNSLTTTFTAIEGESIGGWADFFRELARSGRDFSIRDEQSIAVATDESSQLDYTDALTVTSSDVLQGYELDQTTFCYVGDGTAGTLGARIGATFTVDGVVDSFGELTGDRQNVGPSVAPIANE